MYRNWDELFPSLRALRCSCCRVLKFSNNKRMYKTICGEKWTMGVPPLVRQRFIGVGKSLATFCGRYRGARASRLGGCFDINLHFANTSQIPPSFDIRVIRPTERNYRVVQSHAPKRKILVPPKIFVCNYFKSELPYNY